MKKILSLLLVATMTMLLFAGCGGSKDNGDGLAVTDEQVNTKTKLETYEFSSVMGEKLGVLTYNGDAVKFTKEVFDNIANFDVTIKNENGSYTTNVIFEAIFCADAETYYQELKNDTESNKNVASSQFSQLQETVINGIPVQYFDYVYSMVGGNENKDFYCFVDFPVIDNDECAVLFKMHYGREAEVLLTGLEDLLVDIEIKGVKPGVDKEDTSVEKEDETWFSYTAPTALGDSISSMIYQIDGVLYRFPTPLSEFVNNGWTCSGDLSEEIAPNEITSVFLKNDKTGSLVQVQVKNGSSKVITAEESLVIQMKLRYDDAKVVLPEVSRDGALVSVFHAAITFPKLKELGTHSAVDNATISWASDDGKSKISLICYGTDEYGNVKYAEFTCE